MGSVTINGYVMAGGASTRFGFDKARAELNGEAMLARMCKSVKEVTGSVGIVAPFERYAEFGERLVEDHWPGQGPLGGIISALIDAHTRNDEPAWCLIVGCDMPFLNPALKVAISNPRLVSLKDRTVTTRAAVVAPQSARGLEPLCACWHTSATDKLQFSFEDGIRKVTDAMKRVSMEVVDEKEWKRFDEMGRLFWNMNTPAEYAEARRIVEAQGK